MVDESIHIKNITGVEFQCKSCGLILACDLNAQKAFFYKCPNCSKEWIPQADIEALRGSKHALRILAYEKGAITILKLKKD